MTILTSIWRVFAFLEESELNFTLFDIVSVIAFKILNNVSKSVRKRIGKKFVKKELRKEGWKVIIVWECEIRKIEKLRNVLLTKLNNVCP